MSGDRTCSVRIFDKMLGNMDPDQSALQDVYIHPNVCYQYFLCVIRGPEKENIFDSYLYSFDLTLHKQHML